MFAKSSAFKNLFLTDIALVGLTAVGCLAHYFLWDTPRSILLTVFLIYCASKVIGYLIQDYDGFDAFIAVLKNESKIGLPLSGFEIFKSTLVFVLYLGFLFIDPFVWIIESILVIVMRIWVRMYHAKRKNGL